MFVRISPEVYFNSALGIFKRFMNRFRLFSHENPFVPAVAIELGDGPPSANPTSKSAILRKALEFMDRGRVTSSVFAARWAYAMDPDSPEVLNVLLLALLWQARIFKRSVEENCGKDPRQKPGVLLAHLDTIVQNLTEAERLVKRWQRLEPENSLVQKRSEEVVSAKGRQLRYFDSIVRNLWGVYNIPSSENISLVTDILRRMYVIDLHPKTRSRLLKLCTAWGVEKLKESEKNGIEKSLRQALLTEAKVLLKEALAYEPENTRISGMLAYIARTLDNLR